MLREIRAVIDCSVECKRRSAADFIRPIPTSALHVRSLSGPGRFACFQHAAACGYSWFMQPL